MFLDEVKLLHWVDYFKYTFTHHLESKTANQSSGSLENRTWPVMWPYMRFTYDFHSSVSGNLCSWVNMISPRNSKILILLLAPMLNASVHKTHLTFFSLAGMRLVYGLPCGDSNVNINGDSLTSMSSCVFSLLLLVDWLNVPGYLLEYGLRDGVSIVSYIGEWSFNLSGNEWEWIITVACAFSFIKWNTSSRTSTLTDSVDSCLV